VADEKAESNFAIVYSNAKDRSCFRRRHARHRTSKPLFELLISFVPAPTYDESNAAWRDAREPTSTLRVRRPSALCRIHTLRKEGSTSGPVSAMTEPLNATKLTRNVRHRGFAPVDI